MFSHLNNFLIFCRLHYKQVTFTHSDIVKNSTNKYATTDRLNGSVSSKRMGPFHGHLHYPLHVLTSMTLRVFRMPYPPPGVIHDPSADFTAELVPFPSVESPIQSMSLSPIDGRTTPDISGITLSSGNTRGSSSRSRPRRRSSQQCVSPTTGRVSIAQVGPQREVIAEETYDGYDTSEPFLATPLPDLSNSDQDRFFPHDPSSGDPPVDFTTEPVSFLPVESPIPSRPLSPINSRTSPDTSGVTISPRNSQGPSSRSLARRRSSQRRVSLIAGRVSIIQIELPSPPPAETRVVRTNSATSPLSVTSVGVPSPTGKPNAFLTKRSISEFVIEREIGRGAYGFVERAREMLPDGTYGVSLFLNFEAKIRA